MATAFADDMKSNMSPPSGASSAWTSDEPVVRQARQLVARGQFAQAEMILRPAASVAGAEMLQLIERLRHEYDLDATTLLEKARKSIPDANPTDLDRWRAAGQLQHRIIDGRIRYFSREPANLFRFSDEAKARRKVPSEPEPSWKLVDHLKLVVAEASRTGRTEVVPIRHRIYYTLRIPGNAPGARAGSVVRVWLPFAQEYRRQREVLLINSDPPPTAVADNVTPHRTVFYEQRLADPSEPIEFKLVFDYTSWAYCPQLDPAHARPLPGDWGDAYLTERPPHILFTAELRRLVAEIVGNEANPLAKARRIFRWVDANIRYCAEEEYSVIPSLTLKALEWRRGDCGIQAIVFITMCRAAGVPARWQSGWETKPVNWNMHDWAEFYVEPWGWLPADPSYGLQESDDPAVREFYCGHQDSYRLIVNLDYGQALVPAKPSLRSEPADFQRGEVELDGRNLYFNQWDYEFRFEQSPG